jgi:hypothetical protein
VDTPEAARSTSSKAILPPATAGTRKASAWSPAGTMLLVPLTVQPSPCWLACGFAAVQPVARLALLVGQHHQRFAPAIFGSQAALTASGA